MIFLTFCNFFLFDMKNGVVVTSFFLLFDFVFSNF